MTSDILQTVTVFLENAQLNVTTAQINKLKGTCSLLGCITVQRSGEFGAVVTIWSYVTRTASNFSAGVTSLLTTVNFLQGPKVSELKLLNLAKSAKHLD